MKRCSTSVIISEMQIKTTMKHHFTPARMAMIKKSTNAGECVEKRGSSDTAGGVIKQCNHFGIQVVYKAKHRLTLQSSSCTLGTNPNEKKTMSTKKKLHTNVYSSFFC